MTPTQMMMSHNEWYFGLRNRMFLPEFDSVNHINISLVRVTEEEGRRIHPGPLRGFLV